MPLSYIPAFTPACPPVRLGAAGTVLTSNGLTSATPPTFSPAQTPPTLVQSAFTSTDSVNNGTVTLASNPTVGNTLLAIGTGFDNQGGVGMEVGLPAGFGILQGQRYQTNNQAIAAGIRVVQGGDGKSWVFSGGNGGDTYGVFEFEPLKNVVNINSIPPFNSVNVLFGAAGVDANAFCIGILETDSANTFASISGATLLFDGTAVSSHPSIVFQVTTLANVVMTYTANTFGASIGMLITLT